MLGEQVDLGIGGGAGRQGRRELRPVGAVARDAGPAPVEAAPEAAVEPELEAAPPPIDENPKLLDLLDKIELANTCAELNACKEECAEILHEAHRNLAKASVVKKAKELQLKWDTKTSQYLQA